MTLLPFLGALLLQPAPQEPAARAAPADRIEIRVDPRVELLAVVMRLAKSPPYTAGAESAYLRAVDAHFGRFAEHAAVRRAIALRRESSISFDAPQSLAVHLSPDAALAPLVPLDPFPETLEPRWRNADVPAFLADLRDFARESGFFEFFASQRAFYDGVEAVYREAARQDDVAGWFDGLFGPRPGARFTLVPGLLHGGSSFGVRATLPDGAESLYQILGVDRFDASGRPVLGPWFLGLLVHEAAHSYVNPIVGARMAELGEAGAALFGQVEAAMRQQAYTDARIVLCESLVRACVVLHALERRGESAAASALGDEESRAFLWTAPIVDALRRFRAHPPASKRFEDHMPVVVAAFREAAKIDWTKQVLPFRGPINAVFTAPGRLLVVRPDPLPAPAAGYLDRVFGLVFEKKGAERASAPEVAPERAAGRPLVLYGSPDTNPLLARIAEDAGWSFEAKRLRVGARVFEGEGLALVACWRSPFDPSRPVVAYASASADALSGIHDFQHGTTDWVVTRVGANGRHAVVAQGNFPKDLANRWSRLGAK